MDNFYQLENLNILFETEYFLIRKDEFPVSPGHLLIISKDIKLDYFALNNLEKFELCKCIDLAKEYIVENYPADGFNIGMNCGGAAGQTVFHFHCHVIPRYYGDMENPKGGVRNCIIGKGNY